MRCKNVVNVLPSHFVRGPSRCVPVDEVIARIGDKLLELAGNEDDTGLVEGIFEDDGKEFGSREGLRSREVERLACGGGVMHH